ncbi:MAG: deoxyguanosinetriphosphate triphosphohydrolase, partial [Candidatus Zixiibacteriota bacterium]
MGLVPLAVAGHRRVPLINRTDIEKRESETLAPYAARAAESRGRVYPQEEHPLRTVFQRDRDRIIHSAAFRRMEYKTQVFLPREADHFRTRLTHSIEVAQVSRTLARNLGLNEDLTEAIALVHDVGHTPFGHSGEDVLNELLSDFGGFNHNRQSLRVVDILEQRYRDHPGLNLSYEVREGIVKHETKGKLSTEGFQPGTWPTLEASLVDKADELAYNAHDIDDGISSGLISLEDLRELAIYRAYRENGKMASADVGVVFSDDLKRHLLVRFLIDMMATDLLSETASRLERLGVSDLQSLRLAPEQVCCYSGDMGERVKELKSFLSTELYSHPHLVSRAEQAGEILRLLFEKLTADPT